MKFFTSLWFKIRKSNGLPTNNILIPMSEKTEQKLQEPKPKRKRKPKELKIIAKRAEE